MADKTDRRGFLNRAMLGAAGIGAGYSLEEKILLAAVQEKAPQAVKAKTDIPPGAMPYGKVGKLSISRLLIGGNLIGGWAHSRDLLYTSMLFKAYNTEEKILDTLALCEACGINTIQVDPRAWDPVLKYNKERGGKMQTIVCYPVEDDKTRMSDTIKRLVDQGASMLYPHGMMADEHVRAGQLDVLAHAVEVAKAQGVPSGMGSHSLEVPIACEKNKLNPDFYLKTFHMDRYWSATLPAKREEWCWYKGQSAEPGTYHDNMWCLDSEKTAAFMASIEKPWFAFKVMAAGALQPQVAFPHAYRHGADFIVAGMFDFQVEQDAKIAINALRKLHNRPRPWRA
jgi:hypothetical protein